MRDREQFRPGLRPKETTPPDPTEEAAQQALFELLSSSKRLPEIAELLGANEYLQTTRVRGSNVYRFDTRGFLASQQGKKIAIPRKLVQLNTVILPAGAGEIQPGVGEGVERGVVPRSEYLLKVLKEIGVEDFFVVRGAIDPKAFRKMSYLLFVLTKLRKGVLLSDELNQATFIIHALDAEQFQPWLEVTKDQLQDHPREEVTPVKFLNQEHWSNRVKLLLTHGANAFPQPKPQALEAEVAQREVAPQDWIWINKEEFYITIEGNGRIMRLGRKRILQLIQECRIVHPEWIKEFVPRTSKMRKPFLHISVDGLKFIQQQADACPPAPVGWMTEGGIHASSKIHVATIQRAAAPYKTSHPEWFKSFTSSTGNIRRYLAPELQSILYQKYGQFEQAPAGWSTGSGVMSITERGATLINPLLAEGTELFPAEQKIYRDVSGHPNPHYSTNMLRWVQDALQQRQPAPMGWLTANAIAERAGVDRQALLPALHRYSIEHPGTSGEFEHREQRKMLTHYAPEVLESILTKYGPQS